MRAISSSRIHDIGPREMFFYDVAPGVLSVGRAVVFCLRGEGSPRISEPLKRAPMVGVSWVYLSWACTTVVSNSYTR